VGLLCTFTLLGVNLVGVRSSALLQAFSTFGLLLIGLVFFAGSNLHGSTSNLVPMWTGVGGVFAVTMMTPFFYTGFDVIPQAAEEIRIPKREVGKLILFSVTLAAGWYMLIQWGVGLSLDDGRRAQSSMPTADAAAAALGHPFFGKLIAVGGLLGILTSWNAFFVGATRLLYSMARAGLLPAAFAALHPRFQTPHFAIVFVSLFTFAAPFFGRQLLVWAANSCSFALVIAYLFVAISFIRLRHKEPELPRPFTVSRPRLVGVGAVLSSALFMLLYLPGSPSALVWPQEWGIVLGWTALGLLIYSGSRRRFQSIPPEERELRLFGEYARTSSRQPN
jgi:amino acid transporter